VDLAGLRLRITRSVALVDGVFEIGSPKSGEGRTVSLQAFVADLLAPGEPDALVFADSEGGHMRGTNVRYGHLYGSDVEAVGVAMSALLTRKCGHGARFEADATGAKYRLTSGF
jgi:hypothetical protein